MLVKALQQAGKGPGEIGQYMRELSKLKDDLVRYEELEASLKKKHMQRE